MQALEVPMKKHNIHLDTSSTTYSRQPLSTSSYAPSTLGYAFNVSSFSPSHEWIIDSRSSYHMAHNEAMFSILNGCNINNIYVGNDISISVVGSIIVHLDNGYFKDILCVPTLSCNLLLVYQITHLG